MEFIVLHKSYMGCQAWACGHFSTMSEWRLMRSDFSTSKITYPTLPTLVGSVFVAFYVSPDCNRDLKVEVGYV